jgi:predicted RNA-binding Zn-ribbon protein involved in translation (DUF1610 family)
VSDTALTRREDTLAPQHAELDQWTPSFAITVDDAVQMVEQKRDFMSRVMRKDEHFGVIPGTGTKPTLLKPGAELLLSSMGLHPSYETGPDSDFDINGERHGGEAYIRYHRICRIYRQTGPGEHDRMLIAEGEGSCNSWEKKYRYVNLQPRCPECGKNTIFRSKNGDPPPWFCWKKKEGCGRNFRADDGRITSQKTGRMPNPDIADLDNTILKMAGKRALIAATLLATGCSDLFTQDVEDLQNVAGAGAAVGGDDAPDDLDLGPDEPQAGDGPPAAGNAPPQNGNQQRQNGNQQRQQPPAGGNGEPPADGNGPPTEEQLVTLTNLAEQLGGSRSSVDALLAKNYGFDSIRRAFAEKIAEREGASAAPPANAPNPGSQAEAEVEQGEAQAAVEQSQEPADHQTSDAGTLDPDEPVCPNCGRARPTINRKQDGSAWLCAEGKGGCSQTFEEPITRLEFHQKA